MHSKADASAKVILGDGSVNNLFRQVALAGDAFNSELTFASRPFFLVRFIEGSSRTVGNLGWLIIRENVLRRAKQFAVFTLPLLGRGGILRAPQARRYLA